ncbi:polyphosphate kinase 2 family protein [Lutimonas saemankumensis]|uniref:PPK2 family polyphosphate kinase n=1 Tax=Lutimonas saemankumensis TaxID=483016 RepID=UPI001CD4F188|nr:PPK2 family polyphosphate kinase [Lutimonas saemankumensis]MCA0931809.1 polyphosphate kinase 2 family protein [Lutimonas saemankumensis]
MPKITPDDYMVKSSITLKDRKTLVQLDEDEKVEKQLRKLRKKLGKLQDTLYAHGKYAVLICIQGMDTAGKDSMIKEVFKDFNTSGLIVHSFKVPTPLELDHDYLWRHYIALPARGKFAIFNRTHYENVLVTRVHPSYILGENQPGIHTVKDVNEAFWDRRFEEIKNFEKHLADNGTIMFKFFLHLSKEEQKNRLLRRLNIEDKHWKFSPGDLKERKLWNEYQVVYEDAINRTSTSHAPWFTIPADNKPSARYIVASILYQALKGYSDIKEPPLDDDIRARLEEYKAELNNE